MKDLDLYERKYFFETKEKEQFLFPFVYSAYDMLSGKAHKCIKTSDFNNTFEEEYECGDVVFGSVELCKKAFNKCNVEVPKYIGYLPEKYKWLYGRDISIMNYEEVMKQELPIFVKPKDEVKRFTGTVFESDTWRTITLNGHEDIEFYVSGVLDFTSEWRVFVHNGEIYACQHYDGHPMKFPDNEMIRHAKTIYERQDDSIIAYTIDVGITSAGATYVIEFNDMWATGSYGAPDYEYTMAYIDRWLEIINK